MGVVSLVRSVWVLSYVALSVSVVALTGAAIKGVSTKNRTANLVLTVFGNQMSELPLMVVLLEAIFYVWLTITGTSHVSGVVRFFNYVNMVSAFWLLYLLKQSFEAKEFADGLLNQLSKESKKRIELPEWTSLKFWKKSLNPLPLPQNCAIYNGIPYWSFNEMRSAMASDGWESVLQMELDVYRPNSVEGGDNRPVFVYIHGGGWTTGSKSMTGPILAELISRKWVVVSIDYRLTAKAGYPTQLTDCKRALRWIKDQIDVYGGDPNNIVVGGDSAGGQLAALVAMTPNLPEYQPGFEDVDTTVQGCVPQSASMDLTDMNNRVQHGSRERFIKEICHREGSAESPENMAFLKEHSPMFRVKDAKVPFLLVQGDLDVLAPVQTARDFVKEFQSKSETSITYLEIPGAHHAFHVFSSPRTWYTVLAIAEWLEFHFDKNQTGGEKKVQVNELVEWGW